MNLLLGSGGISAASSAPMDASTIDSLSESEKPNSMLVMSGGEGYIDFRVGKSIMFVFLYIDTFAHSSKIFKTVFH